MKIFVERVGKRPVGFRSAAWDLTPATIQIVKEMGFLYESSMMADDRPYSLVSNGKETGLIELPVEWILDDWPLFQISWPSKHVSIRNADDVYSIWKDEFDGAYEEGTLFLLTMHPQVIGHRYRMQMLDKLISYMKSKPGVWFATHEQIARYVQERAAQSDTAGTGCDASLATGTQGWLDQSVAAGVHHWHHRRHASVGLHSRGLPHPDPQ